MKTIKLGTRASRLALAQASLAAAAFARAGYAAEIVTVRTRGDADLSSSLSVIGRGAFTDVFSAMIESGEIDAAVHSAKDLPTGAEKDGFYCLAREDARDVLVMAEGRALCRVGTGSPRRAAAVKKLYPQAEVLPVRGNVDTRLKKLFAGEFDSLVLAAAGLKRLALLRGEQLFFEGKRARVRFLSPEECVPAACQGIIAIEGKAGALVNDEETRLAAMAERAAQRALGGDCTGGAGAYLCGGVLYVQKEGRSAHLPYCGEESVAALIKELG